MAKYEIIAGLASSLSLFAFIAVVFRIYSSRVTQSLSTLSLLSNIVAQGLLLFYAIQNNLKGLMYPIFLYVLGIVYILYVKIIENKEYY